MVRGKQAGLSTLAALVAITMMLTMLLATDADAAPDANTPQQVKWNTCYRDISAEMAQMGLNVTYECTSVNVPLDHDRPNGPAMSLALVRLPASDPDVRRGSVFLNPGGPGGSGVDFALFFGPFAPFVWGPVANQYDIVGFDPRGIARSTPLRCFGTIDQAVQVFPPVPFPFSQDEVALFEAGGTLLDDQCTQRGNKVLEHMSTASAARDLDLLRAAVGDERLNYVGLSYGSYLGQTYANLFPDRVGAFVIDGVLDPNAWANVAGEVPFTVALRSDEGAQETLDEFVRQCDAAGAGNCALAPGAQARLDALLTSLRDEPILITDPETGESFPYLYSFAVVDLLVALYNPFGYAEAAEFFAFLESQADPAALGAARQAMQRSVGLVNKRGFPNYPNFVEGAVGVACEDTNSPKSYEEWFAAGKAATEQFGVFGEAWTWALSPCASWSSADAGVYTGPYDTATSSPPLVIGNLYDPATRYEGAVTANGLLDDSVLVTVDEPGHTSLGLNVCAGLLTGRYLADPVDYAELVGNETCPSEGNWFDKAGGGEPADAGMQFRTRLMEQMAFRP